MASTDLTRQPLPALDTDALKAEVLESVLSVPRPRGLLRRRSPHSLFAALDAVVAVVAIALALAIDSDTRNALPWVLVALPLWLLLARLTGLHRQPAGSLWRPTVDDLPRIISWIPGCIGVWWAVAAGADHVERSGYALDRGAVAVVATTLLLGAAGGRGLLGWIWLRATDPERALLIGDNGLAALTERRLSLLPQIHVDVAGRLSDAEAVTLLADPERLDEYDRVLFASDTLDDTFFTALSKECAARDVLLNSIPSSPARYGSSAQLSHVGELPIFSYAQAPLPETTLAIKRLIDLVGSALLLVLSSPLFLACAVAVKLYSDRGPVLYRQQRVGRDGVVFTLLKFRTMHVGADKRFHELVGEAEGLDQLVTKFANDPRVTRAGRWLRRASLDELPQLWNVLRGDMSLVGPRPETEELASLYSEAERFRLAVKPGLTGPMQVFGRAELNWQERQALERDYINHLSVWRDLRILTLTPAAVVRGTGAS